MGVEIGHDPKFLEFGSTRMMRHLKIGGAILALSLSGAAVSEELHMPAVCIAELEIDAAQRVKGPDPGCNRIGNGDFFKINYAFVESDV